MLKAIPGYNLLAEIYESSHSLVYRGIRQQDNQPVILKVLKAEYPTPTEITKYKQQYEITRNLNLEGVAKAYSLETYQNSLVIILEDFGGDSLKILMNSQKFNVEEFLTISIKITEILGEIHAANIIHKDINPANIAFNPKNNQLKIIDFGTATVLSRENPTIENINILEGNLAYMSPEQTGRMNRSLDYRTDFYSLGVTFYELLTHQLPFKANDAIELVHSHIAKQPIPPHAINSAIPKAVSNIVMKLLAKTAEDRYQSAWGIKADLEDCFKQLKTYGKIEEFSLARQDISSKFQITQNLYGRQHEINTLLAAFERVSQGTSEMMLIPGYSGIGKSVLIEEISRLICRQNGYFISGKFEQLQRNIPYSAIVSAFQALVRQILTAGESEIQQWKEKLLAAFGSNGALITDVIPELELIVGSQPAVQDLNPIESQNRFNLVFQNFIRVFCQPEHPLVIFLDDMQWSDSATLKVIDLIMGDTGIQYLYLICAYRDNEVDNNHFLHTTIESLKAKNAIINIMCLNPLNLEQINQLIVDTLYSEKELIQPLAELLLRKTAGNPLFINEFLKTLYQEKLLNFDFQEKSWKWDICQIESMGITDNVADLMAGKLQKLPPESQEILCLAACVGNSFDLNTISSIYQQALSTVFKLILPAVDTGLILPTSELEATSKEANNSELLIFNYKFLHNRVRQTAYALLDDYQKQSIHLQIGRLLSNKTPEAKEDKIFELVDHLNLGKQLIVDSKEKLNLAVLNLATGKKAKAANAYASALQYLLTGISCLNDQSWNECYELTSTLHRELAEVEYLNGNLTKSEALINRIISESKSEVEKADVYNLLIVQYTLRADYAKAIKSGIDALRILKINIPEDDLLIALESELQEAKSNLGQRDISSLLHEPDMQLNEMKIALNLLNNLAATAYLSNQHLYGVIVLKIVNLSLKYGNVPESAHGYCGYGILLTAILADYQSAYKFGKLAINLTEKFNNLVQKCQAYLVLGGFINSWTQPIKDTKAILDEAYQAALESGNLQFAGYSLIHKSLHAFQQGKNLEEILEELPTCLSFTQKTQNQWAADAILAVRNAVLYLTTGVQNEVDETKYLADCQLHQSFAWICTYQILKSQVLYLYEQPDVALYSSLSAEKSFSYISAQISISEHNFYSSLILAALYNQQPLSEQQATLDKITANQTQMKIWAENCLENFLHKYLLVEAEIARLTGNDLAAMKLYDRAIESARENNFIQNEALANELAAKFWLIQDKAEFAKIYMTKAYYGYHSWGAVGKVKQLENKYFHLLARSASGNFNDTLTTASSSTTSTTGDVVLDLATAIKASQVISGEIVLSRLLEKLMSLVMENAGAQTGFLILEKNGNWVIEAEASVDSDRVTVLQSIPLNDFTTSNEIPPLAIAVINYVIRTQKDVVLNDAVHQGEFTRDSYILANQPKSILSAPLVNQGKLSGILYLENNLTTGAFTPNRIELLRLLSSQVAISIENAQLYSNLQGFNQNLETLVTQRTEEISQKSEQLEQVLQNLQQTQSQLIQTEKMSSLGQMVAGIAHEINNPVNFIHGNISHLQGYFEDLLNLIELYQQRFPNIDPEIQDLVEDIDLEFLMEDLPKTLSSMTIGTDRIRQIVLSLRNFSRLDEAEFKSTDIHEGIDNTLLILSHRLKQGVTVVKQYGNLPLVECYPAQLNQVFMNILNNGIDALLAETSLVNREITIHTATFNSDQIQVKIQDNGPGIPKEIQSKLFDPFFTTKPVGKGTGLGLSICYQIIERHHGRIIVNSELSQGTEFEITLPIKLVTDEK